jgi:iron complex outermembrane receptor protein
MMLIRILFLLLCFSFWSGALRLVAAEESTAPTMTEEQKMEKIRSYFQSEYQEEDYFRTDRMLVTATGSQKPVHLAPSVATVITAEDIEKMGARTLGEVLETVPGLHVSVSNKNAMDLIYSIRGIQTSLNPHVLFLLNGNPITFTFTGSRLTTMNMPVADISRVEVVRGPGSAVHGADAFAGTINIITKNGQEIDGTNSGIRYGSFDTIDGWVQHGGLYSGWDVSFNLEFLKSDGDDGRIVDSDLQSLLDLPPPNGFGTSASLAPGPLRQDYELLNANLEINRYKWTARLWYWMNEYDGTRDGVTQLLSDAGDVEAEQFLAEFIYSDENFASDLAMNAHLTYMYEKIDAYLQLFPSGAILPIGSDGNFQIPPDANSKFVLFTDGAFGNPPRKTFNIMEI